MSIRISYQIISSTHFLLHVCRIESNLIESNLIESNLIESNLIYRLAFTHMEYSRRWCK
jgi:hypothetical protein